MQAKRIESIGILALTLALAAWVHVHDRVFLHWIQGNNAFNLNLTNRIAGELSFWGDYLTFSVPLSLVLWMYGIFRNKRRLRHAALACFLAATLAGLFSDCLRLTLGRPRPDAHLPDGFYGIQFTYQSKFQSFPSGHAATVLGTATALLFLEAPLGSLAFLFGIAVCWSRLELNRHYPSDITVGAMIGIYFGAAFALKLKPAFPASWSP